MSQSSQNDMKNEGEGNRTADRKYREGVRQHVKSGAAIRSRRREASAGWGRGGGVARG
jgi:hypothetical protein